MFHTSFYKYLSLIKLVVGLIVLFVDYVAINVFEDPIIAVGILLLGCFLVSWGASFFFFLSIQKIFKDSKIKGVTESDSYKLSLLFGMYALLNIILIFLGHWSKLWGLILLCGFIFLLYSLLVDSSKHAEKSE